MHFTVAAGTDIGRVRKGNEDHFFADANDYRGLFIVADGMGGHAAGEVASQMAVDIIAEDLADLNDLESVEAPERVVDALKRANDAVYKRSKEESEKYGMGSTASVLVLADERFIVGHIGDSRVYLLREGKFQQITHDHSFVQERVDAGMLTPEQARNHRQSNVITRCIGMSRGAEPDIFDGDVRSGDIFLITSDGLTSMVDDRRVQQLLSSSASPPRIVDALIAEANSNGGIDNITVVVVRIDPKQDDNAENSRSG